MQTDQDVVARRAVVLAQGASTVANVPALAAGVPAGITTLDPGGYRNADQLPEGGVLVVGASASGVQIADELHRSGRPVTLAVGEHVRMPRTYRGRDIQWWMDATGMLDERYDEIPDLVRVRNLPSMQLVGIARADHRGPECARRARGATGRAAGGHPGRDRTVLGFVAEHHHAGRPQARTAARQHRRVGHGNRFRRRRPAATVSADRGSRRSADPRPSLRRHPDDLWATGFRPDLSWLDVPVLDRKGRVRHDGGVTASPGLYLMGMPFMRRRKSTLIDGAAADAADLSEHLVRHLAHS